MNGLAPGRIDFGVGTGFSARRAMGLGAMKLAEMEEYIRVVYALLAGETVETPIGLVPAEGEVNTEGLSITDDAMRELLTVDDGALRQQLPHVEEFLAQFGDRLPDEVSRQLESLKQRLG